MSKTRILIHIVFCTKYRHPVIPFEHRRRLYAYIHGIIGNFRCQTLRINGTDNHIHILINLHPTVALAALVKELKRSSTIWMKDNPDFAKFTAWNSGYYAASIGSKEEIACIEYIKNQETHHRGHDLLNEMKVLAMEYRLDWDDRDWSSTPSGVDADD